MLTVPNRLVTRWAINLPKRNACRFCGAECRTGKDIHFRCKRIELREGRKRWQTAMDV